jgi:hypothetical protein
MFVFPECSCESEEPCQLHGPKAYLLRRLIRSKVRAGDLDKSEADSWLKANCPSRLGWKDRKTEWRQEVNARR